MNIKNVNNCYSDSVVRQIKKISRQVFVEILYFLHKTKLIQRKVNHLFRKNCVHSCLTTRHMQIYLTFTKVCINRIFPLF